MPHDRSIRSLLPPALLACALVLAACGTSEDREQARTAAERLYAAVATGDGAGACAQLSESAREELESQQQSPCEEAILGLDLQTTGTDATKVEVYMTSAVVHLTGGDTVFLEETRQGWRVSALGCSGQSTETPADCEAQA